MMVTDKEIAEKQKLHGYDWHNAYLSCLLERQARMMAEVLFSPKRGGR